MMAARRELAIPVPIAVPIPAPSAALFALEFAA